MSKTAMYNGTAGGGSVENLHHKDERDGESLLTEDYEKKEKGKVLVCVTFFLECAILGSIIVLEYFLRWTTVFPIRKQNFSCKDTSIAYSKEDSSYADFDFNKAVPIVVIYVLTFCVPPFVMLIGEIGVWAFADEEKKTIRVGCRQCVISQVLRRLLRFIGVFLFGIFTLMIFVDILKFVTGRLRPTFLEICDVNCTVNDTVGGDELCLNKDEFELRDGRTSFPSLHAAITAYSAVFLSIYIHGALRTRSVRVLRPFLSMAFCMLSLLCGLLELGRNYSHWEDIVVGFAMGITMAIYLGCFILYNFREYVSERKLIRLLHGFLIDHQLLNELTKDGKMRLFPFPFHIPRAHTRNYQKFHGIKARDSPLAIYGEENDPYSRGPHHATNPPEEHGLSHL